MATLILSAAGAAVGAGFGGSVLGLSGAVIGRAVGATIGRSIDQRILGSGSEAVEQGRVSRFSVSGASDGAAVARVWGVLGGGGAGHLGQPVSRNDASLWRWGEGRAAIFFDVF